MILRRHFEQEIKMINREMSEREQKKITEVLENAAVIFARIVNDTENLKLQLAEMKRKSLRAMEELAQLAVVSDKFIDSIKAGEDDGIYTEK